MTRGVGRGQETRGSIELVYRVDLKEADPDRRLAVLNDLVDQLKPGATIEIVLADMGDHLERAMGYVGELVTGGVRVKLVGSPAFFQAWHGPVVEQD